MDDIKRPVRGQGATLYTQRRASVYVASGQRIAPVKPLATVAEGAPKRAGLSIKIRIKRPKWLTRLPNIDTKRYRAATARTTTLLVMTVMVVVELLSMSQPYLIQHTYALGNAGDLLPTTSFAMSQKIKFDGKQGTFNFNQGFSPALPGQATVLGPQITAVANQDPSKGVTVTDPVNKMDLTITPKMQLSPGQQNGNSIVYPLMNGTGWLVYTMQAGDVKEDLLMRSSPGDTANFDYTLDLGSSFATKTDAAGNVGIYGSTLLSGNVSTGTAADAALLVKAKAKAPKDTLLFVIPAPTIKETGSTKGSVKAKYTVQGNNLRMTVTGLDKGKYPLTIDPSIYVETAQKFMRGNNETNISFDVANSLIQKGKTTGARINAWSSTNDLSTPIWGQGTAVAGGYIYTVGGAQGTNTTTTTYYTAGSSTYVVPTGVTSITVKAWGAGGGGGVGSGSSGVGGAGGGGGYAKATLTVTPAESLTVLVGTGGTKGVTSGGGNGGGYSAVQRSSTFLIQAGAGGGGGGARGTSAGNGGAGGAGGGASALAGSAGLGSGSGGGGGLGTNSAAGVAGGAGTSGVAGSVGAANSGGNGAGFASATCNTAVTNTQGGAGGTGAGGGGGTDTSTCSDGGGGGSGRFGGGGGGSTTSNNVGGGGGGGGSDLVTGTGTVETTGSGTTPGNNTDTENNGAGLGGTGAASTGAATNGADGGITISYTTGTTTPTNTVSWAQFNTTTNAIQSPDPGAGACTGWCTDSSYNLPASLTDLSLVAYNGFLYAIGGANSSGVAQTSVYIAKLGANGEPQLWHPSGGTPVYWYTDTALSNARSKFAAVVYNNHMYILGGLTGAGPPSTTVLSSNTVQMADIRPTGTLTTWTTTGTQALPVALYGLSAQVYNNVIYIIGGDATFTGTPVSAVRYSKLNSDGTMNSWVLNPNSLITSGRLSMGGSFSAIWGGYVYVGGGCTTVNASGYCTAIASDVQLASINADGSLDTWSAILGLDNTRIGHTLIAWQNGLYRLGGCRAQDPTTGTCTNTIFDVDYGVINQDGDASTVAASVPSGTAPCSGGSPVSCDLPSTAVGNVLNETAIINGYLYIMGGCTTNSCSASISTGVTYQAIASDGTLHQPASCTGGTLTDSYCVSPTNLPVGLAAAATAIFGGRIYLVGGFNTGTNVYYVSVDSAGTLGTWQNASISTITGAVRTTLTYAYAYARANPASAGTSPGNLYIFGGCTDGTVGCTNYSDSVFKCVLSTTGVPSGCVITGQQQIGTISGASSSGLGAMAGAVYANYIYLIGGLAPGLTDLTTARYAKFDNSNNVVAVTGSSWVQGTNVTAVGRRRGAGFGYNGYLYVVGGYDGGSGNPLADIEFAKINVSDGSWGAFTVSSVTINQRWGLSVPVSTSFAYVIGGCTAGAAPGSCSARTNTTQTFQIYNNDNGAPASYTAGTNLNAAGLASPQRAAAGVAILNGYIYYAGGCVNTFSSTQCGNTGTTLAHVAYAPIDANGIVGTWAQSTAIGGSDMPVARAWGKLFAVGGTLYWIGGVSGTGSMSNGVQWCNTFSTGLCTAWNSISSGGGAMPATLTNIAGTVWNNRIYIVGGSSAAAITTSTTKDTIYYSPDLSAGGAIPASPGWTTVSTAFNVKRSDATAIAYANNLYVLGGYDGANYLNDVQYLQINSDGSLGSASYTTSLPNAIADADGFAANGYMYLLGGRSTTAATTCSQATLLAPISANTTIASGNNPTGVGDWYQTNVLFTGTSARYGDSVAYANGKAYVLGGGCNTSFVSNTDFQDYSTILSQPQVASYSIMIDTDTDVFPTKWLLNGLDNSIGAAWQLKYSSMTNPNAAVNCAASPMTTWGQETNAGNVTLGTPGTYTPKDGSGTNTNCARFFFLSVSIDSSQAFGYPEDVTRGPTITDLTLEFTADPSKRLMHGRTFTGGVQQPDDTPF